MSISQRKEPFRYNFTNPLFAEFCLLKQTENPDEPTIKSSVGDARVFEISPNGLRITTLYDLPQFVTLEIYFVIYAHPFEEVGTIVWKKKEGDQFIYGIKLNVDDDIRQKIINELKVYSKENPKKVIGNPFRKL